MVIFAAGVVTGGMVSWRIQRANFILRQRAARLAQPVSPGGLRFEFLRRAERELDLSPEQRERIDQVLKESQERTRKIMEPISPHLRQELKRTKEEFRAVLTTEQQQKFDELIKMQPRVHRPQMPPGPHSPEQPAVTNSSPLEK
jgi:hypothetical protein